MQRHLITLLGAAPLLWACGGSVPEPKQPMADAESAARSAREVGANAQPRAKLHVKLADEQIADARKLIAKGDNERATYVLVRARADAELALALAREQNAINEKQQTVEQSTMKLEANAPGVTQ
jgi:hypothetical protein